MDCDPVIVNEDTLLIICPAFSVSIQHIRDIRQRAELIKIHESAHLFNLIREDLIKEQVAVLESHRADRDHGNAFLKALIPGKILRGLCDRRDDHIRISKNFFVSVANNKMNILCIFELLCKPLLLAVVLIELYREVSLLPSLNFSANRSSWPWCL